MTSITADDALIAYLAEIRERTEIRDESGKLIGIFAPACDLLSDLEKSVYADIIKEIDPVVYLQRRERSKNGPFYTHAQVMEHLRSLEAEEERRRQAEAAG